MFLLIRLNVSSVFVYSKLTSLDIEVSAKDPCDLDIISIFLIHHNISTKMIYFGDCN